MRGADEDADERRGQEHDGRNGGIECGRRLLRELTSEICHGAVGSSMYFQHDLHVDDENDHRHDEVEQDDVDVQDELDVGQILENVSEGLSSPREQRQSNDHLLREARRAVHVCL